MEYSQHYSVNGRREPIFIRERKALVSLVTSNILRHYLIHSRVLVILGNSGVPSDKRVGTPGVGSAYLRIGVLVLGI